MRRETFKTGAQNQAKNVSAFTGTTRGEEEDDLKMMDRVAHTPMGPEPTTTSAHTPMGPDPKISAQTAMRDDGEIAEDIGAGKNMSHSARTPGDLPTKERSQSARTGMSGEQDEDEKGASTKGDKSEEVSLKDNDGQMSLFVCLFVAGKNITNDNMVGVFRTTGTELGDRRLQKISPSCRHELWTVVA